mmetsp:Transcript_41939/g.98423  ORF Transcript_41939/g.98423 Transcript_41939/m.98423 type:complete len:548 (+) Transcript_41939:103-1746(+)
MSFAFLSQPERDALGGTLSQLEACTNESAAGLECVEPPARAGSVLALAEFDGHAVAADQSLLDAYIRDGRPVLVRDLATALRWPACVSWASAGAFVDAHGAVPFKLTDLRMPAGMGKQRPRPLRLPLGVYARYVDATEADFPWYCFGDDFLDERVAFLADYTVPPAWSDDLYELGAELRSAFPAYRFMVIGGARTGSNLHVDPDFTAAWNALLAGTKRWALFPPFSATPDPAGQSEESYRLKIGVGSSRAPPLQWWLKHYERLAQDPSLGMVECEQRAGDIIYVPAGWWHCVLNTVPSGLAIAVTQNLLPPLALSKLWPEISKNNPGLAAELARLLAQQPPDEIRIPAETLRTVAAWLHTHEGGGSKANAASKELPPCVLFFSVDGVLAKRAKSNAGAESNAAGLEAVPSAFGVDENCIRELARVVEESGAELVLTASWRGSEEAKAAFGAVLGARGLFSSRAVTMNDLPGGLASQILHFTGQAAIDRWAVVDADEFDLFGGKNLNELSMMQTVLQARCMRTDAATGLDAATADELIKILTTEEEDD